MLYQNQNLSIIDLLLKILYLNQNSTHTKSCAMCNLYKNILIIELEIIWKKQYGNVNYVIKKLEQADQTFIEYVIFIVKLYNIENICSFRLKSRKYIPKYLIQ